MALADTRPLTSDLYHLITLSARYSTFGETIMIGRSLKIFFMTAHS